MARVPGGRILGPPEIARHTTQYCLCHMPTGMRCVEFFLFQHILRYEAHFLGISMCRGLTCTRRRVKAGQVSWTLHMSRGPPGPGAAWTAGVWIPRHFRLPVLWKAFLVPRRPDVIVSPFVCPWELIFPPLGVPLRNNSCPYWV